MTKIFTNDMLIDAYNLAGKRESLCKKQPSCPFCGTHQVQIIDTNNQKWKCRHCFYEFKTRYRI